MDGYELAARLKMQEATSQVTLIAVTGYGQAQDRQRSIDAVFAYHLVKPVDLAALRELLAPATHWNQAVGKGTWGGSAAPARPGTPSPCGRGRPTCTSGGGKPGHTGGPATYRIPAFDRADTATIRKLFTTHVGADRFCEVIWRRCMRTVRSWRR